MSTTNIINSSTMGKNDVKIISSRIPKRKRCQSAVVHHILPTTNENNNGGTDPLLQLHLTKLYVVQDPEKNNKIIISPETQFNNDIKELADKISELCGKINSVESHMLISSQNIHPEVNIKSNGDIELKLNKNNNNNDLNINNDKPFKEFFVENDKKTTIKKDSLNLNLTTSQLFSSEEFTFENMFKNEIEMNSSTTTNKFNDNCSVSLQNLLPLERNKFFLPKTLALMMNHVEEIMKRINSIEENVTQINYSQDSSQVYELNRYCKMFLKELLEQKSEVEQITNVLKECCEKFTEFQYFQDQVKIGR